MPVTPRKKPTFSEKVRYYIDLFMSSSSSSQFIGLFALSFILVTLCAILIVAVSPETSGLKDNLLEAMWWAMIRVIDTSGLANDQGALVRLVAVLATLSGIMVVALLISLVSSSVRDKIEDLRRGKSPVIDNDHTLILGFSDKIYPILRELREANRSRKYACIVILSPIDKQKVETLVAEQMGSMLNTRVVVREGSPFSIQALEKVGAGRARSIIILSADVDLTSKKTDPDMNAIKTLLALRRIPGALERNHAVVELQDEKRAAVIQQLGNGGVEIVSMRETLARIIVQTSRQSGLARVYRDLLDFDGSELYIKGFPELAGLEFSKVGNILKGAIALGIRRRAADGFDVLINPKSDSILTEADELIVLADDDNSFSITADAQTHFQALQIPSHDIPPPPKERILICGIRSDLDRLLDDFNEYVAPGSEILLMPGDTSAVKQLTKLKFPNMKLSIIEGNPTDLDDIKAVLKDDFNSILHVANDKLAIDETDAFVVISLLMMRDLIAKSGRTIKPKMISEILNPRTKDLVSADEMTDFVVSSEITSMILAQVSEQRDLNKVYMDLFSPSGSEIYMKSIERYLDTGSPVLWPQVQSIAQSFNEIAIGCYRNGSPPLIHPKADTPLVFKGGDKLIVLAENSSESAPVKSAA